MNLEKKLVSSIIKFLNNQIGSGKCTSDQVESLEVAVQCLEAGFEIDPSDGSLEVPADLLSIFKEFLNKGTQAAECIHNPQAAEQYKHAANELMKQEKFKEAVELYSKLAYTNMNQLPEAIAALKKALELEPDNVAYQTNLKVAEEKLKDNAGGSNRASGIDLSSLLTNPALLNMATQVIQDPGMQQIMSGIMSGNMAQSPGSMNALLEANPDLVDQLRRQMQGSNQNNNSTNPEPQDPSS